MLSFPFAARPEGAGELRDGENAFLPKPLEFLFSESSQQAEVVRFDCLLTAPVTKLADLAWSLRSRAGTAPLRTFWRSARWSRATRTSDGSETVASLPCLPK